VWVDEIAGDDNAADVGRRSTTLVVPYWLVRVAEGGTMPIEPRGHRYQPLAAILRPWYGLQPDLITKEQVEDLRVKLRSLVEINGKLGLIQRAFAPLITGFLSAFNGATTTVVQASDGSWPLQRGAAVTITGANLGTGIITGTLRGRAIQLSPTGFGPPPQGPQFTLSSAVGTGNGVLTIDNGFGQTSANISVVGLPTIVAPAGGVPLTAPPETPLTITGTNLGSVISVKFALSGQSQLIMADRVIVVSDTQIQVIYSHALPIGAGNPVYTLYVNTDTGQASVSVHGPFTK
jgi:hypothetical protein